MAEPFHILNTKFRRSPGSFDVIMAQMLLFAAIAAESLVSDNFATRYPVVWLICGTGLIAVSAARLFNWWGINNRPIIYIILYHPLVILFLVYIAPVHGLHTVVWLLLLYGLFVYYGRALYLMSLVLLFITYEAMLYLRVDPITVNDLLIALFQFSLISLCSYVLVGVQANIDAEHGELSKNIAEAELARQRLRSLIDNIGDAVIATDEDGRILLYNGAALALLDTNQTLDGKSFKDHVPLLDEHNKAVDIISLSKESNRPVLRSDLHLSFSDQDIANVYINITPIKAGYRANREHGFTIIMRDITKEKSLDQERDEFISVVSHELRTPVTIAEGNVSNAKILAKNIKADSKINEALSGAHKQILYLADMINDLATLSRAESATSQPELEKISPVQLVDELVRAYKPQADQKRLTISSSVDKEAFQIVSSRLYVKEILQNLITNAIKYTRTGGVRIAVAPTPDTENSLDFAITDTGIGISKSDQQHLFDKFFRSEDYRTRESNGTGLGLYIAMKLSHKLKGVITVTSEINEGSAFTLTVPSLASSSASDVTVRQTDLERTINAL